MLVGVAAFLLALCGMRSSIAAPDPQQVLRDFRAPARATRECVKGYLWTEAEAFADYGGWRIDTQFVANMGSAYLIAPGVLTPVSPARTKLVVPTAGVWRAWVRTRDWLPEFSPGKFALEVGGRRSGTLGASKKKGWRWELAGDFDLAAGNVDLAFVDLSAGYARCDAVLLTQDLAYVPPEDSGALDRERRRLSGLSTETADGGCYDVVVVGAGPGGLGSAIAAARHGVRTLLVHDRPVLGGNNSMEQTVSIGGAGHNWGHGFINTREGGIVEEARLLCQTLKVHQPGFAYGRMVEAEKLLTERPNERVTSAAAEGGRVTSVTAENTLTGARVRYRGKVFVDATGDGWVGIFAGASRMRGREARSKYGEKGAPEQADDLMMSGCIAEYDFHKTGRDDGFVTPAWARVLPEGFDRPNIKDLRQKWWLEHPGTVDELADPEHARDELIRINYAYWGWLREHPTLGKLARNASLDDVKIHNGRREGWRLVGDYVMTANDCRKGTVFPDAIATGGWHLDLHDPLGVSNPKGEGRWSKEPLPLYTIPYRSIYSKDLANLFIAGRHVSVTHMALGSTRLMGTIFDIGQAAGTAAAMAAAEGLSAREIGKSRIGELQMRLLRDDLFIYGIRYDDSANLAPRAKVTATSANGAADTKPEYAVDGVLRPPLRRKDACTYAWQADPGAALPQELRLDFACPVDVREIRLVFDSGLSGGAPERPRPRTLAKDYAVLGLVGGEWKTLAEAKDNCRRLAVHPVRGTVTAVRIRIDATWGFEPRIQEVMVFAKESVSAKPRERKQGT